MSEIKVNEVPREELSLVPVKQQEKSLVVVKKKKLEMATICNKKVFKEVVKTLGLVAIGTISVAYITLMMLVATSIFYVSHLQNGLIQRGVYINEINVSELSQNEALGSISSQLNTNMPEYIVLKYEDNKYQISLRELEAKFDVETAVDEAYSIGRTQNVVRDLKQYIQVMNDTVNINANLQYNEQILDQMMQNLGAQLPNKVEEYSYEIKGNKLIINRGKSGIGVKADELKNIIVSNLENRKFEKEIEIPVYEILPKEIDVVSIHNEVFRESKNAYYTENPITIYEQVIGIDFDVENVQKLINQNPDLAKYTVNLNFTNPDIFVKDLNVFPDRLSTFGTKYVNNLNRTTNLVLASGKINGTVLMPGEIFSFNKIVGERTIEAGYKNAAIFVNGEVEDGLAGGICQISSTLYDAVVSADLEIMERHNHSKLTSYLPGGKDATVVWGVYDFQFKNTREYPIKIEMSVQNGVANATIYGIKSQQEYEINIESEHAGMKGQYTVYNAYKVYRQNGVEVKREFLSRDLYK